MTLRLGIVGGGGWMGQAIARAVLDARLVDPRALTLSWRSRAPEGFPDEVELTRDNAELCACSDVVVLSVRPGDWAGLALPAPGRLVISVMAGVALAALAERHETHRVIRTLPNAAAEVGASYTPIVAAPAVNAADRATARAIFACCGPIDELAREDHLDYFSGLTGTGPAYPALMAAAMVADATARGIPRDLARRAVSTLFIGAGRLLERSAEDPDDTVATFLDYRGVTAAGLAAMRDAGFDAAIRTGLAEAFTCAVALAALTEPPNRNAGA